MRALNLGKLGKSGLSAKTASREISSGPQSVYNTRKSTTKPREVDTKSVILVSKEPPSISSRATSLTRGLLSAKSGQ